MRAPFSVFLGSLLMGPDGACLQSTQGQPWARDGGLLRVVLQGTCTTFVLKLKVPFYK